MKTMQTLTDRETNIVDTLRMRCEREWVDIQQFAFEFRFATARQLLPYVRLLRAEGYVFERRIRKRPRTNTLQTLIRITDYKEKKH